MWQAVVWVLSMVVNQQTRADLPFAKMQALGNDFVVVEASELERLAQRFPPLGFLQEIATSSDGPGKNLGLSQIARILCDRHFGVGADGLIVVCPPTNSESLLAWRFFNADGSQSSMCGNGLRCLARFAQLQGKTKEKCFSIETEVGAVALELKDDEQISCDLNQPILASNKIPVAGNQREPVVKEKLSVQDKEFVISCVSMGNPHCVVFEPNILADDFVNYAQAIQAHDFFPEGVNVEFVQVLPTLAEDETSHVKVFVCERGCGPTLACASGAAAVLVAGVLEGRLQRKTKVEMPGGTLEVNWSADDNHVRITGPASRIYNGVFDLGELLAEAKKN
jgi:diaminopimelate epimerase